MGYSVREFYYPSNPETVWNSVSYRVDENLCVRMPVMEKCCTGEQFLVLTLERSFFPETVECTSYASQRATNAHIGMKAAMVLL